MGEGDTAELDYLACDTSGLTAVERDQLLEDLSRDVGSDLAIVGDPDDLAALTDSEVQSTRFAGSVPGPQIGEVADPELLLIVLESTLIAIEAAKIGKKASQKTSGNSALVRETIRSALESRNQPVTDNQAESVDSVLEQHE